MPVLGETNRETLSVRPKEMYLSEQRGPEAAESFVFSFDKLLTRVWALSKGQVCWMKAQ